MNPSRPKDGFYSADAVSTQLGPQPTENIWEVYSVPDTNDWLLRDVFLGGHIIGSYQQFWVSEDAQRSFTYCGHLRHFLASPSKNASGDDFATVVETWQYSDTLSTASSYIWCANNMAGGCSLFKLNLTTEGTGFSIKVELTPPVVHYEAHFTPTEKTLPPTELDHLICQTTIAHGVGMTWDDIRFPRTSDGAKTAKTKKTVQKVRKGGEENALGAHCYVLHNTSGFTLAWSPEVGGHRMNFSAIAGGGWVALGFDALYPGMLNAKVLVASPQDGVQVKYATEFVGTPQPSNWTTIKDASVSVSGGVTSASMFVPTFKRDDDAFHIFWAYGDNEATGFNYHGANRGVISLDLADPEATLPSWIKC